MLSTMTYTLSSRILAHKHRDQYIIDYQNARYACDSAVKYAKATLENLSPGLISRPNEPDFSDEFAYTKQERLEILTDWAERLANDPNLSFGYNVSQTDDSNGSYSTQAGGNIDPNEMIIRGPYGYRWPLVVKSIELEIGNSKVDIRIEDENAKYPICWMLLDPDKNRREINAGFDTFCDWMEVNDIDGLMDQLDEIADIKTFKLNFKLEKGTSQEKEKEKDPNKKPPSRRRRKGRKRSIRKHVISPQIHTSDFIKLLHSSIIDIDVLARPTSVDKNESALKYTGLWAAAQVNINSAPRHVLEAALMFAGDAELIADKIIELRRIEPFGSIDDMKKRMFKYTTGIDRCKEYITTTSTHFTIKITATNGNAKISSIIAIEKKGKRTNIIAIISG